MLWMGRGSGGGFLKHHSILEFSFLPRRESLLPSRSGVANDARPDGPNMNTIVNDASRLPHPFVLRCRNRTVAKVDSIGFVVRRCTQCSAGKS